MLSVIMLNAMMLSVVMLSVVMLNAVMLSVVMLNAVMLSVVILSVMALKVSIFTNLFSFQVSKASLFLYNLVSGVCTIKTLRTDSIKASVYYCSS
jgi:hypothetical protein